MMLRPLGRGQIVEQLLDLVLDEAPLLLDDDDLVEPVGEAPDAVGLQRPAHADLVEREAEAPGRRLVDGEVVERLAHVEIGFSRGDDAEPAPRPVDHGPVEPVRPAVGAGCVELVFEQSLLLVERRVGPADVEPALGKRMVVGHGDGHTVGVHRDDGRAVHRLGDADEADPEAGVARERPAVQPKIQELLHAGRVEHRHGGAHEVELALVRRGRGGADMVVAGQREHATVRRRAGVVGVLEDVHRAVDARPLAVPDGEDAVLLRAGEEADLLGAPEGGGRQVLVDPRLEQHAVPLQEGPRLPQRPVEIAERRAAVAGDQAGRVEPGRTISQMLHHGQPDQRLGAGHVDLALPGGVLVVERDRGERHHVSCRECRRIIPHGAASPRRGEGAPAPPQAKAAPRIAFAPSC